MGFYYSFFGLSGITQKRKLYCKSGITPFFFSGMAKECCFLLPFSALLFGMSPYDGAVSRVPVRVPFVWLGRSLTVDGQCGAIFECEGADRCDRCGNGEGLQRGTARKCVRSDAYRLASFGKLYGFERSTIRECVLIDPLQRCGEDDLGQRGTAPKRFKSDLGASCNRHTFQRFGNTISACNVNEDMPKGGVGVREGSHKGQRYAFQRMARCKCAFADACDRIGNRDGF